MTTRPAPPLRHVSRFLAAAACAAVVLAGCGTQHAGPQPGAAGIQGAAGIKGAAPAGAGG